LYHNQTSKVKDAKVRWIRDVLPHFHHLLHDTDEDSE
jgi:hypothetical protein